MNFEDLLSSFSVGELYFDMDLESSWSEDSFVQQIFSISHPNDHDVVEGFNPVYICQQLIDHLVTDLSSHTPMHSSLLTYSVNLIKDDNVQWALVP